MTYPATVEVQTPEQMDRWRPLVQWILAIPHLIIAGAMEYAAGAVAIVSWFIIMFTGRLPADLAKFQVMIMRYTTRAQAYAGFLFAEYPPYDFTVANEDPGGCPAVVNIAPQLEDRDRLTVGLRFLWAIPAFCYTMVIAFVGALCWFAAFFVVLFTGRWPEGLLSWVMKSLRVSIRFNAYASLLTDEYPPYSTD